MSFCSISERGETARRRHMRMRYYQTKVDPQACRAAIWACQDEVMQAIFIGDQSKVESGLIQLAYLTDSQWYLNKIENEVETVATV